MAKIEKLAPILFRWEGGYKCEKEDPGDYNSRGELVGTKYGVSAGAYENEYKKIPTSNDMKNLTPIQASFVLKRYWNACKADNIENQSIANLFVDWHYNSGVSGIKAAQKALDLVNDGLVGSKTLAVLNGEHPDIIFSKIWNARKIFFENIVKNKPQMGKYLNGWLNRLNGYKFSKI